MCILFKGTLFNIYFDSLALNLQPIVLQLIPKSSLSDTPIFAMKHSTEQHFSTDWGSFETVKSPTESTEMQKNPNNKKTNKEKNPWY